MYNFDAKTSQKVCSVKTMKEMREVNIKIDLFFGEGGVPAMLNIPVTIQSSIVLKYVIINKRNFSRYATLRTLTFLK